jgi:hypothetical protein
MATFIGYLRYRTKWHRRTLQLRPRGVCSNLQNEVTDGQFELCPKQQRRDAAAPSDQQRGLLAVDQHAVTGFRGSSASDSRRRRDDDPSARDNGS